MKFYLDTGSLTEIQEIARLGILDGIAMNAKLVTKQGVNFHQGIREICRYVDSPISVGVLSIEEDAIVKEGKELAKIHRNVLVKCPLTPAGLKATKRLTAEGIRVNVCLCFSLTQALIAAKAGAWCVSNCPQHTGGNQSMGNDITRKVVTVFRSYGLSTQVFLAGVSSPHKVLEWALAGGHICTMRFACFVDFLILPSSSPLQPHSQNRSRASELRPSGESSGLRVSYLNSSCPFVSPLCNLPYYPDSGHV